MPLSANELVAKFLRLQTERENLVYVIGNTELSAEEKAHLQARLQAVQNELLLLTGGISLN